MVTRNRACITLTVWLTSHLLIAGLAGYGTQICMTYALKFAKAAPAIAMSYLSVVWGLLGGFFFFHEVCIIHSFFQTLLDIPYLSSCVKDCVHQLPVQYATVTLGALKLQLLLHSCCVAVRLATESYVLIRAPCSFLYARSLHL